jgi:CO/xanthine dehydrogenase Mo-binding subunit
VISSDTDLTPVDLGAYSSRVTLMMGHAAQEAARKMRGCLQAAVAAHWQADDCKVHDVLLAEGRAYFAKDTGKSMPLHEAFALAESANGSLVTSGSYRTQERGGDYRGGTIGASPAYSCSAHIADVEVDCETGLIRVHKIWAAHDCGRAINPVLVEGQIEGSTYMGAAEVSLEHMLYGNDERKGMLLGPSLLDYRIPTSMDTPDIQALIIESTDPNGPYGAKEAGEGPLHSSIPAIANAIFDAVGIRMYELPFGPAQVLAALSQRKQG